ncbi:hypothetical protein GTO89_00500 [Heliobacterium gestii]|uniref:Uncharacterized protein n=1 Tax=Heliomicrobium gestii TaxID=2699 RepID=A0A845L4K6_HELGE|nr:hypothetical protein [Heliomicrobium gestii]MBM7865247.1 hypothetical protein [Heliomicrobium gestii]MZP41512.1 hypothetical protein [Heliomicrobium gestii]
MEHDETVHKAPQLDLLWVFARFLGLYIIFLFLGIFTTALFLMTETRLFGYLSILAYMVTVGRGALLWARSARRTLLIWGLWMGFLLAKWGYCAICRLAHSASFLEYTPNVILFTYDLSSDENFNFHLATIFDALAFTIAIAIAYFGRRQIRALLNYLYDHARGSA